MIALAKAVVNGRKPPSACPLDAHLEKFRFGALDLLGGGIVEVVLKRLGNHVLTDRDQFTAQVQVMDCTPFNARVDDRHRRFGEPREVIARRRSRRARRPGRTGSLK